MAALSFSFWVSMLSPEYDGLWQTTLHRIASRENGKGLARKSLAVPLKAIRMLRNRVAHHEPILHWNLPAHYANILQITRWLSPAAADWSTLYSRFPDIYPDGGIHLFQRPHPRRSMTVTTTSTRTASGDGFEGGLEEGEGLDTVHLRRLDQRSDACPAPRSFVMAHEQCILSRQSQGADAVFQGIGIQLDTAVFEEHPQPVPLARDVGQGLDEAGFRRSAGVGT